MCSIKGQSHTESTSSEYQVNQCVVHEEPDKTSDQKCYIHVISLFDDKNCQSTLCYDKRCQETQCVHIWPVKPAMKSKHMWSVEPAVLPFVYKKKNQMKHISVCDDKNCQSTKSAKYACDDRNCESIQCIHMQPASEVSNEIKSYAVNETNHVTIQLQET